tara:strand:+ start:981 stop:1511 length:531 start_codon:yes stop_codon:yes gene_type:complete
MNIDKTISDISLFHKEWILYVQKNSFNYKQRLRAEDFVQNMYCAILESSSFDCDKFYNSQNQINKNYVFKVLRSLIVNDYRKKNLNTINLDYVIEGMIKTNDYKINYIKQEKAITDLKAMIKELPSGDILSLYIYEIPSIRKLSKELGKSTSTIRIKINNCKELLKKKLYDYAQKN